MEVVATTKSGRTYHQRVRAAQVAANTERILEATQLLAAAMPMSEVTLEAVAHASETSVQSVLRRFGSRDSLISRAFAAVDEAAEARLAQASEEDLAEAIRLLALEYERWGDALVHLLGQESSEPLVVAPLARGRAEHEHWVKRVFAPALARRERTDRRRLLGQLIVVTDVMAWHKLRRGRRLGRRETERAMREMASSLIGE